MGNSFLGHVENSLHEDVNLHGPLCLVAGATSANAVVGMVNSAFTLRHYMVNGEVFSAAAIDTLVTIPSLDAFSPHSFSVTATEREEFKHEASGSFHWLIGLRVN